MDSSSRRRLRHMGSTPRGVSLIEGMVASVVLLIGLMAVFQGIMVASQQNAMANHSGRASGIASQVRVALDSLGRDRVFGAPGIEGMLSGGACDPDGEVRALAGGLEKLQPSEDEQWTVQCIFDLDAFEQSAPEANRLLPGYAHEDELRFRRVLVWVSRLDAVSKVPIIDEVAVVVSWNEMGRRRFVRQHVDFYNSGPLGNATNTQI